MESQPTQWGWRCDISLYTSPERQVHTACEDMVLSVCTQAPSVKCILHVKIWCCQSVHKPQASNAYCMWKYGAVSLYTSPKRQVHTAREDMVLSVCTQAPSVKCVLHADWPSRTHVTLYHKMSGTASSTVVFLDQNSVGGAGSSMFGFWWNCSLQSVSCVIWRAFFSKLKENIYSKGHINIHLPICAYKTQICSPVVLKIVNQTCTEIGFLYRLFHPFDREPVFAIQEQHTAKWPISYPGEWCACIKSGRSGDRSTNESHQRLTLWYSSVLPAKRLQSYSQWVLGLVRAVSVHRVWVRWQIWSVISISVWQHAQSPELMRPWDTLCMLMGR